MYVNVLNGSKLESKLREKPRGSGRSVESIMLQMKRCSSLGDLDISSGYKGRNVRESYVMAIYKGWENTLELLKVTPRCSIRNRTWFPFVFLFNLLAAHAKKKIVFKVLQIVMFTAEQETIINFTWSDFVQDIENFPI